MTPAPPCSWLSDPSTAMHITLLTSICCNMLCTTPLNWFGCCSSGDSAFYRKVFRSINFLTPRLFTCTETLEIISFCVSHRLTCGSLVFSVPVVFVCTSIHYFTDLVITSVLRWLNRSWTHPNHVQSIQWDEVNHWWQPFLNTLSCEPWHISKLRPH